MPSRRQVLAGLGSAGAAAVAGCLDDAPGYAPGTDADADWPMPRYDSTNTAYSPDAKAPRDGVRERWTFSDDPASGTPAVADGAVFLPTTAALVALDAGSGEERWRFEPSSSPWPPAPVVHGGTVYVTDIRTGVHAVDADSGEAVWSLTDAGDVSVGPHLVTDESIREPVLYVGTENGEVLRLDPESGEITWRTDLFGGVSCFGYRRPTLYVGTVGGEIYSFFDPVNGADSPREGWRRKVGSKVEAILPAENGVLVHTFGGPLRCLRDGAHAGTTRWTVDSKWANSAPVSARYTVFAAGYDGLVAVREYDAKRQWRVDGSYAGPVAAGDTLYASGGDAVHAFALDGGTGVGRFRFGAKRWSHPTPGRAVEGLVVADGALFAACEGSKEDDTALYCLEPA